MTKGAALTTISSDNGIATAVNTNLSRLNEKFENTLSLDGSEPNAMQADLDMNGQDIINVENLNTSKLYINGAYVTGNASLVNSGSSGVVYPQDYGAVGDGVTDDSNALEDCFNSGQPIYLQGNYLSSRSINVSGPITLQGQNAYNSQITFTAGGLNITPGSWTDEVYIDGLTLLTAEAGLSAAIKINRLALGTTGIPFFSVKDRITNCVAKGVTAGTHGWKYFVQHDFPFGLQVNNNDMQGKFLSSSKLSSDFIAGSAGVYIPDQATRTLANVEVSRNKIFGFLKAVDINNVEGFDFHNNDVQVCYDGYVAKCILSRLNQHRLTNNHIGVTNTAVDVDNVRHVLLSSNEVSYRFGRTDLATVPMVKARGVQGIHITGGTIRGNVSDDLDMILVGFDFGRTALIGTAATIGAMITGVYFDDLHLAGKYSGSVSDVMDVVMIGNVYDSIRNSLIVDEGAMSDTGAAPQRMGVGPFGMPSGVGPLTIASATSSPLRIAREAAGYMLPVYSGTDNADLIGGINSRVDALEFKPTSGGMITQGTGSPEGVRNANPGSYYGQTDAVAGKSGWIKESGTGNTGWKPTRHKYADTTAYTESGAVTRAFVVGTSPQKTRVGLNSGTYDVIYELTVAGAEEGDYFDFYINLPSNVNSRLIFKDNVGGATLATMFIGTSTRYFARFTFDGSAWRASFITTSVFI